MSFVREGGLPVWHFSADKRRTACGLPVLATDIRIETQPAEGQYCTGCAAALLRSDSDGDVQPKRTVHRGKRRRHGRRT